MPGTTLACQRSVVLSSATFVFHFCAWQLSDMIAQGRNFYQKQMIDLSDCEPHVGKVTAWLTFMEFQSWCTEKQAYSQIASCCVAGGISQS